MCKVTVLRELMKQRLNLAVEEIYQLFEQTIMEYEEELRRTKEEKERQGHLLGAVLKSQVGTQQTGEEMQQVLTRQEEEPIAEHPIIKKEEEDVWSSQDGEQPRWPEVAEEEADMAFTSSDKPHNDHRLSDPDSTFAPLSDIDEDSDYAEEEAFRCPLCPTVFSSQTNMKRHMTSHQQIPKTFACSVCMETFPTRGLLRSHRKRHVVNCDIPKFDCSECGQTFTKLARLNRHMAKHTGEKPFVCTLCGKKFTWHYALKRHMRSHSSREHYSCPVCAKGFTTKWYIAVHMRTHTGEKPFQCDVCLKQFHFKTGFKKHNCVVDSQNAGNKDGTKAGKQTD